MTLRRELWRVLTEPTPRVNLRVFALVLIMLIIMLFGLVVALALHRWFPAMIYFGVGFVYAVLTFRHWPWRRLK